LPPLALVTLGAALASLSHARLRAADDLPDFGAAPTFAGLIDQHERTASADDFRGRVVLANFVYTSCKDICPLLSAQMSQLQTHLRRQALLGERVRLLSFSVDPSRDTPEVLRAYAARYRADPAAWRFLTGSEGQLVPLIVQGFHLGVDVLAPATPAADDASHASYEVMHSGRFVLIDKDWRIRAYYDSREIDAERVLRDVTRLLD
jgi:protein SCO1/2